MVPLKIISDDGDHYIELKDILNELKGATKDKVANYMVSYFGYKMNCFVFTGVNVTKDKKVEAT